MRPTQWKLIVIAAVIAWALFQAWPSDERPILNMRLGLDLKGGSHLVYRVETGDAVKDEASVMATRVGTLLRDDGGFVGADARIADDVPGEIVIDGIAADRNADARSFLEREASGVWQVVSGSVPIRMRMPSQEQQAVRDRAVRQVLTTLTNRIDELGVAEPVIQRAGVGQSDRIIVQLPGVEDPTRVKDIINQRGRLEKRLLYYDAGGAGPYFGATAGDVLAQLGGAAPPGVELLPGRMSSNDTGPEIVIAVERTAAITGSDLQDARPQTGQWGDTVVGFTVRVGAANRFGRFTRENIGRQMAIVLDGKVQSAPTINGEISTSGMIEGSFTYDDAEALALVLRAGALPAGIVTLEERTVGPSLGRDSIVSGIRAAALGFALVMVFMVIYYKISGINAVIALVLNLLIVAAVMASLDATLTLPGIGGFILTVGMAVDANVLIFERVREELRAGKTVKGSLEGGFGKALSAIVDANVTTLIAAFFLFQYGTGPVRGFAVTLFIGIIASMFTAIFVSRTIFDAVIGDRVARRLSI